jgi:peptide/nickel transport system substrate-binding protein
MAAQAGFKNWVQPFQFKSDRALNVEVPAAAAFRMVKPINTQAVELECRPYFCEMDTEGNQLPYIDRIKMTLAESAKVANLRAMAGEYDYLERHMDLAKLPTFLENVKRGNYTVHLDLCYNGSDTNLIFMVGYEADPEIGNLIATADFRRALSLGIDRDQINDAFFLGLGTPGSVVPAKGKPQNPGPEWRGRWTTHDPAQANAMLDRTGLTRCDAEGYRLRRDNGQRLRLTSTRFRDCCQPGRSKLR